MERYLQVKLFMAVCMYSIVWQFYLKNSKNISASSDSHHQLINVKKLYNYIDILTTIPCASVCTFYNPKKVIWFVNKRGNVHPNKLAHK